MSIQDNLSELGSDIGMDLENDEISLNQERTFVAPNLGVTGITYRTESSDGQTKNQYNKLLEKAQINKANKNKKMNKVDQMLMISNIVAKNMIKDAMMNQPTMKQSYLREFNDESILEKTQYIDNVSDKNFAENLSDYQDQFFENMNVSDLQDEKEDRQQGLFKTQLKEQDSISQLQKHNLNSQSQKLLRTDIQGLSTKQLEQQEQQQSQKSFQDISSNNRDMSLMRTNIVNESNWINEEIIDDNSLDMSNLDDALDRTEVRKKILQKLEGSTNEQKKQNMLSSMVTQHNKGVKFGQQKKKQKEKDTSFNLQAELIEEESEYDEEDEDKDSVRISYIQDESVLLSEGAFNRPEKVSTFDRNDQKNPLQPIIEQSKENLTSEKDIKSSQNKIWESKQDSKISTEQSTERKQTFGIRRLSNQSNLKSTFNEQLIESNNDKTRRQSAIEITPKIIEEQHSIDFKEELEEESELDLEEEDIEEDLIDYSKNSIDNIINSQTNKNSIKDKILYKNEPKDEQDFSQQDQILKDVQQQQHSNQQILNQDQNLKTMESQTYDFMTTEQEEKLKEFQRRKIDSIQQNFQRDKPKILSKSIQEQPRRETLQLDLSEGEIEIDDPISDQEMQQIEDFISESNSKGSDNQSQNKLENDTLIVESVYKKTESNPFKESLYSSKKNQDNMFNSKQSSLKSSHDGSLTQTQVNRSQQQPRLMHSTFTEKKFVPPSEVIMEQSIEQFNTFNPYVNEQQEFSAQQNYFEIIDEPYSPAFDNRDLLFGDKKKFSIKKKPQKIQAEEIDDNLLGTAVLLPQKSRESIMDLQRKKQFSFNSLKPSKKEQSSEKDLNYIKEDFAFILNTILQKKVQKRQMLLFILIQYTNIENIDYRPNIVYANLNKILLIKMRDAFDILLYRGVLKRNAKIKIFEFVQKYKQQNFINELKNIQHKSNIQTRLSIQYDQQRKQSFLTKMLNIENDQNLQLAFKNLELYLKQNKNLMLQESFIQLYKNLYMAQELSESVYVIDENEEYELFNDQKDLQGKLRVSTFSDNHSSVAESQNIQIQIVDVGDSKQYQSYATNKTDTLEKSETVDLNNVQFDSESHQAYKVLNIQKKNNQVISFKNNPIQISELKRVQPIEKSDPEQSIISHQDQLQTLLNQIKKQQKQYQFKQNLDEFEKKFLIQLSSILLILEKVQESIQLIPESETIIKKTVEVLKVIFDNLNRQRKSHKNFSTNSQATEIQNLEDEFIENIQKLNELVKQIDETSSMYQSITQDNNMTSVDELSDQRNESQSVLEILSQNSDIFRSYQVGLYSVSTFFKKYKKRIYKKIYYKIKAEVNMISIINKYTLQYKKNLLNQLQNFALKRNDKKSEIEYLEFLILKKLKKNYKIVLQQIIMYAAQNVNLQKKVSIKNFVRKSYDFDQKNNNKLSTKSLLEKKNLIDSRDQDISKLISLRTVDNNVFFKKEKDDYFYQNLEDEYKQKAFNNQTMDFGPNQFNQQLICLIQLQKW